MGEQAIPAIGGALFFILWLLMMGGMVFGWIIFLIAAWRAMRAHETIADTLRYIASNISLKG